MNNTEETNEKQTILLNQSTKIGKTNPHSGSGMHIFRLEYSNLFRKEKKCNSVHTRIPNNKKRVFVQTTSRSLNKRNIPQAWLQLIDNKFKDIVKGQVVFARLINVKNDDGGEYDTTAKQRRLLQLPSRTMIRSSGSGETQVVMRRMARRC